MLLVFDLDFTLWDAGGTWCDCTYPPYTRQNGSIYDAMDREIYLYKDVRDILEELKIQGISLGIASRTSAPRIALELLEKFEIMKYFDFKEIYPASKTKHFSALQEKSGMEYEKMYFYDDEYRNIEDISRLNVNCTFVRSGISKNIINQSTGIVI